LDPTDAEICVFSKIALVHSATGGRNPPPLNKGPVCLVGGTIFWALGGKFLPFSLRIPFKKWVDFELDRFVGGGPGVDFYSGMD